MRNGVFIVFDSARFDSVARARTPWLRKLGPLEKRYSYATWTPPSHQVYFMGVLPHTSSKSQSAAETFRKDMLFWKRNLRIKSLKPEVFLPHFSLPRALSDAGYLTRALVSMPVLNPATGAGQFFHEFDLMPRHNDFESIIERLSFPASRPSFYFINTGETHYPYTVSGENTLLPKVSGLRGALSPGRSGKNRPRFDRAAFKELHRRQIRCVEHLDTLLEKLYRKCPSDTFVVITSDHGELFGEDGMFGHGPFFHQKLFEIPFVSGVVPCLARRRSHFP